MKKYLIFFFLIFISVNSIAQIKIVGAKNTEIIETNKAKGDITEIKDINFTKTQEDVIEPDFIEKNTITNATGKLVEENVEINIIEPTEITGTEKNQIIIDLDKAKHQSDSVKFLKNPEYNLEEKNITQTEKSTTKPNVKNTGGITLTNDIKPIEGKVVSNEIETVTETQTFIKEEKTQNSNIEFTPTKTEVENINETNKGGITFTNNSTPIKGKVVSKEIESVTETQTFINEEKTQNSNIEFTPTKREVENINKTNTGGITFTNDKKPIEGKVVSKEIESVTETQTFINEEKSGIFFNTKKEESTIESQEPELLKNENIESTITTKGNLNNLDNLQVNDNSSTKNSANSKTTENNTSNPKKGSWSLGVRAGIPAIIGDVNSRAGYGFSLNIQKALGHVFSLKFEALALETKGLNHKQINNTYHNYKTRFTDYTIQGVATINNLNFYKKEPKVLYNVAVGAGLATRYTWTDLVDENGIGYNYDNVSGEKTSDIIKAINDIRDKNYETSIPKDVDKMSIKNTNILPTVMLGLGIDVKLSERFDLNLASRVSYHFDDYLDGLKNGNNIDFMTFTSLGLTYKFASKNKSMLWTNPVYSKVEEINELKKKVDEGDLLKDEDKDGIADIFDQDLNTPEKVAVDSRGVPSDLDKDGVPDYEDAEPFTALGAQVDERGIAIDSDKDGIADIYDQENNTLAGSQVDSKGKTIIPARNTANDLAAMQSNSAFDIIFFDENSAQIKKEFYSDLYKILRYIQGNPTAKIEIIGNTDVLGGEDFNLNLSEKRANAVYSLLIEMFKVPSRNLVTSFDGETNPLIGGLPEIKDRKFEAAYYINRRVEFKIIE